MPGKIESILYQWINYETHALISDPDAERMPLVGIPHRLINDIVTTQKGFFIIEAHTGAGKTVVSKTLYHLARFNKLPLPTGVVYVNAQELSNDLNIRDVRIIDEIERIAFMPKSYVNNKRVRRTTVFSYPFQDHVSRIGQFKDILNELTNNEKNLILIIDELDKVMAEPIIWQRVASWATTIRSHFNMYQRTPIKVVITLPKIRQYREAIERKIEEDPATKVFSEFREYNITPDIIIDYIINIEKRLEENSLQKELVGGILYESTVREVSRILAPFRSGRYIFEKLMGYIIKSISLWLERCYKISQLNTVNNLKDIINLANQCTAKPLNISITDNRMGLLDPLARGIAIGKYYSGRATKSEVIRIWVKGMRNLAERVTTHKWQISLISSEINYIIYQVSDDTFLWLSLAKEITLNSYDKALNKIDSKIRKWINTSISASRTTKSRGLSKPVIKILLLVPESSYAPLPSETSINKLFRNLSFLPRFAKVELTVEELLALAGEEVGMPSDVAKPVLDELQENIREQLMRV